MLWHAVAGCCAHHVHAAEPHDQATAATENHGCCGHHHANLATAEVAAEPKAPSESEHDSQCSEQRCVYVTTSSDDSGVDLDSQPCYLTTPNDVLLAIAGETLECAKRHPLLPDGAAMRRHLLLGVLRI
ncbi:hypothetical protein [Blastopirellula retiformator]|uniref:Uncharacterized protein n=1 Tax=Blastopirellula retiformator TaxID=2527970 RepID=A0A5C5V8E9_9BACT|nr:hypothetical protein [Blastopirellula retiformator]TWT34856.1 hypothetical protein Enr8_22710 [Blastopirellula retiformator]